MTPPPTRTAGAGALWHGGWEACGARGSPTPQLHSCGLPWLSTAGGWLAYPAPIPPRAETPEGGSSRLFTAGVRPLTAGMENSFLNLAFIYTLIKEPFTGVGMAAGERGRHRGATRACDLKPPGQRHMAPPGSSVDGAPQRGRLAGEVLAPHPWLGHSL